MEIHCFASIPVDKDDPVSAIRQFARLLHDCAVGDHGSEVNLNLIGSSARARRTIQEFRPERSKGAPFARAIDIAEELTSLGTAQIKSLHFLLSAGGFRWKGASEQSTAKLLLLDAKFAHRKQRFDLFAHLHFQAKDPGEPFVEKMLSEIAGATGIRFQLQSSQITFQQNEPGRATQEEAFAVVLSWIELIEDVGAKIREKVSLAGVPHLMTTSEANNFLFDPAKFNKSVRVDFTRTLRKWLKEEFPEFVRTPDALEGELLRKQLGDGLVVTFGIDKKQKAFSKAFTIEVGIGLTSPRFAPASDRPFPLSVNLFRLFGISPLPMRWTYYTEADLGDALRGAAKLLKEVLAIFEPEAMRMRLAHARRIEEFEGPREVSAKEAYELALRPAKAWAPDAGLIRISSNMLSAQYMGLLPILSPAMNGEGRLAMNGAWWLQFHSRGKEENLYVTVPCRGHIQLTRLDAPAGRRWPSDADQILRDGWIDSPEALRIARAAAEEKGWHLDTKEAQKEAQQFELSSRADVKGAGTLVPPFRDGMFPMERGWRVSLSVTAEKLRRITMVTVPAFTGEGSVTVISHAFDRLGRPIQA